MLRKTRIIATLGPASQDKIMIKKLILAGVNVFRINLSHGKLEEHLKTINNIKTVRNNLKSSISIMIDTRGPEVRVKSFENNKVELIKGQTFTFCKEDILGNNQRVSITQENAFLYAKQGKFIFANDGLIKLKIQQVTENEIICKVTKGGILSNSKGLFFAGQNLMLPYLNEKDKTDILALKDEVDYIAGSFVTSHKDIEKINEIAPNVKFIAKIENAEGIKNIDKILLNSDGIMVARGDLGVELDYEQVPVIQKMLIEKARNQGKIAIVATEMLESMIKEARPTRAETSDVATAIYDMASAIMLSAETAVGCHPLDCIKVFDKISKSIEKTIDYKNVYSHQYFTIENDFDLIALSAVNATIYQDIKAIVAFTSTGKSAIKVCKFACKTPVVAVTDNQKTFNELALIKNCIPVFDKCRFNFENTVNIIKRLKLAKENEQIIIITGSTDEISNCMKLQSIH